MDKSKLGTRYTCHSCGTKYYDLNRPEVACPECGTDPATKPKMTKKALLSGSGRKRPPKEEVEAPPVATSDDDDDDLLDSVDGDDDDESDEVEEEAKPKAKSKKG